MDQNPASNEKDEKRRSISDLLLWLALLPFILGSLICCGQLALLLLPSEPSADTLSRLKADYKPWPYDQIPAFNVEAFINDVQKEQALFGTPQPNATVVSGVFWVPPTATAYSIAAVTGTPVIQKSGTSTLASKTTPTFAAPGTGTPTLFSASPTSTRIAATSTRLPTITASATATRIVILPSPTNTNQPPPQPTRTATVTPFIATPTFTQTPTKTFTPPPTRTHTVTPTYTKVAPSLTFTPTHTFTPTYTFTPTITHTPTITLSPTLTFTPTVTFTPTFTFTPSAPTPTYAPIRPIPEFAAVPGPDPTTCVATFGYRNDNPVEVDIAKSTNLPYNYLSVNGTPLDINTTNQTTHFLVGRQFSTFTVTWNSPFAITWSLNGLQATVNWCH